MKLDRATRDRTEDTGATEVSVRDLERLQVLHELLASLNDAAVSARTIARHVDRFPALRARVAKEFMKHHGARILPDTTAQITVIGNRKLEEVLLGLLEDLTLLRAQLAE